MEMSSGDVKGEKNEIKMSDGTLNFRRGSCFYSSKRCMSTGLEAVVVLIRGIVWVSGERMLFCGEDKSVTNWGLQMITSRDYRQPNRSAVKPDSKLYPVPCKLQLSCTVASLGNLSKKGQ